jgi:hypothetical protein
MVRVFVFKRQTGDSDMLSTIGAWIIANKVAVGTIGLWAAEQLVRMLPVSWNGIVYDSVKFILQRAGVIKSGALGLVLVCGLTLGLTVATAGCGIVSTASTVTYPDACTDSATSADSILMQLDDPYTLGAAIKLANAAAITAGAYAAQDGYDVCVKIEAFLETDSPTWSDFATLVQAEVSDANAKAGQIVLLASAVLSTSGVLDQAITMNACDVALSVELLDELEATFVALGATATETTTTADAE